MAGQWVTVERKQEVSSARMREKKLATEEGMRLQGGAGCG